MYDFELVFDTGAPIVLVGNSYFNTGLLEHLRKRGKRVQNLTLEELDNYDEEWFRSKQFFTTVSSIAFRKQIVERVNQYPVNWLSVVATNTCDPFYDLHTLGRGVFIYGFNYLTDPSVRIGNYSILTGTCASHGTQVGDFCYISPWCYSSYTTLGDGVCLGTGAQLFGKRDQQTHIASWTNITAGSRVTRDIAQAGTYLGNKLINQKTSLEDHIL